MVQNTLCCEFFASETSVVDENVVDPELTSKGALFFTLIVFVSSGSLTVSVVV